MACGSSAMGGSLSRDARPPMPRALAAEARLLQGLPKLEVQKLARDFMRDYIWIAVGMVGGACSSITQELVRREAREWSFRAHEVVWLMFHCVLVGVNGARWRLGSVKDV